MKKILLSLGLVFILPMSAVAFSLTDFNLIYNGYGNVEISADLNQVELQPMIATQPGETHAALVLSDKPLSGNYKLDFTVENQAQLRQGSSPNPWEAPWLVFGYKPGADGIVAPDRTFSYLILKTNGYGLEFGEALPNNGQNFLWTSNVGADSYDVGQPYHVSIKVENEVVTVSVDGIQKFVFSDTTRRLLTSDGYFGFYSEDAQVKFSDLQVTSLSAPVKGKKNRRRK